VPSFVAIDLGATSGRVMLGVVRGSRIELSELRRFPTSHRERVDGGMRWDFEEIVEEVLAGLRIAAPARPVSIGVDTWAVDYGLLDADGRLDGDVRCYRDPRTIGMADRLRETVDDAMLYRLTGVQHLPFNTLYQLLAEPAERLSDHTMLLLPDLLAHRLTGTIGAEVTNASTTALLDARSRTWAPELTDRTAIPASLLPPLRQPGDRIGALLRDIAERTGLRDTPMVAVASHDTASAIAAIPASGEDFGYVCSGTWSLAGLELPAPVLTEQARLANFTNEAGVGGTTRFLRNTMGLWLLTESLRTWRVVDRDEVLAAAADQPEFVSIVDPNAPEFLAPGDMPSRIARACARTGQPVPDSPAATVRTIMESLAMAHAVTLDTAARLAGRSLAVVHLVGGGARNELLCQLTADACGLPVLAGPVEASALGNVLVQAQAAGARGLTRLAATPLARYQPRGDRTRWLEAADRVGIR